MMEIFFHKNLYVFRFFPFSQVIILKLLVCLQGVCPGLTHGQRFGISYVASTDTTHENQPTNQSSDSDSENKNYHDNYRESSERKSKSDPPEE